MQSVMTRGTLRAGFFATVLVLATTASAHATLVTFVHEGVGAGTLNGIPFPSSVFTITAIGDTDDREDFISSTFHIPHTSTSIFISGLGNLDFLTPTYTFVNNQTMTVGFSRAISGGSDLFDGPTNPDFSTWDMLSAIGPYSGTGILLQWGSPFSPIQTSGGILRFNSTSNVPATFQAIPEPSTFVIFGISGLLISTRRRPRR